MENQGFDNDEDVSDDTLEETVIDNNNQENHDDETSERRVREVNIKNAQKTGDEEGNPENEAEKSTVNIRRSKSGDPSLILDAHKLMIRTKGQTDDDVDESLLEQIDQQNGHPKLTIERSVFSQKKFDEDFEPGSKPSKTFRQVVGKQLQKFRCQRSCLKEFIYTVFPFINILKNYKIREDLMGDVVSGLTVGIMHIPQGMAYGMLTTLPPVYGLYTSFFPVLVYFFLGSSKHISIGTFAVACLMVGSSVSKGYDAEMGSVATPAIMAASGNDTNNNATMVEVDEHAAMSPEEVDLRLKYAMSVSFVTGLIQLLMGFFRLGFVTVYLSDPLISGFTTGAACHVFTSQIKHVFGVKTARYSGAFKLIYTYRDFFKNIPTTNSITLIISIIFMAVLYCVGRFINQNPKLKPKMFMPVPIELIVVVLGTLISYLVKLNEKFSVVIVDDIPTGIPAPTLTPFSRIQYVISDSIALSIVIFAISISMGKLLAKKHDYEVNANQDLIAFGISTMVSSFFSATAASASLSRSLVQERVGGRTQVAGLVSCVLLLVVLLAIGPYFRTLPNCVLAAIIIVALKGMFLQVLDLKKLWSVSLIDFLVWIVAFLATVVLDVDLGLGVAVIFNILSVVCRNQQPNSCLLGQMPNTDIYRDINSYQEAEEVEGIKIFRFEQSLFFVNTEHFRTCLYKRTINPRVLKIAQKKKAAKLEKKEKKKQVEDTTSSMDGYAAMSLKEMPEQAIVVGGPDCPDLSISDDFVDMEVEVRANETRIAMVERKNPPDVNFHTIIVDCSPWSFVDSMGVKVLSAVIMEYKAIGVRLCLASCKGAVREMFLKTSFYDTLDHSNIYVTIHDAVLHSLYEEFPARDGDDTGEKSDNMLLEKPLNHEPNNCEPNNREPSNHSTVITASDMGYKDLQFVDEETDKQKQTDGTTLLSRSNR